MCFYHFKLRYSDRFCSFKIHESDSYINELFITFPGKCTFCQRSIFFAIQTFHVLFRCAVCLWKSFFSWIPNVLRIATLEKQARWCFRNKKGYQFPIYSVSLFVQAHQFFSTCAVFFKCVFISNKKRCTNKDFDEFWLISRHYSLSGKTAWMHNDTDDNCWFIIRQEAFQVNESLKQRNPSMMSFRGWKVSSPSTTSKLSLL